MGLETPITKEESDRLIMWANDKIQEIAYENPKIVKRVNDFDEVIEFDTPDGYRITFTITTERLTLEQRAVYGE